VNPGSHDLRSKINANRRVIDEHIYKKKLIMRTLPLNNGVINVNASQFWLCIEQMIMKPSEMTCRCPAIELNYKWYLCSKSF